MVYSSPIAWCTGYFVVPPWLQPDNDSVSDAPCDALNPARRNANQDDARDRAAADWKRCRDAMVAEARRGEAEWVRCGGVLYDSEGRRDLTRTEALLAESQQQADLALWHASERCWDEVYKYSRSEELHFEDVPWPQMGAPPLCPEDLDPENIAAFFALGLDDAAQSRRDRVRQGMLRWHPDKMVGFLEKVVCEDREDVRQGGRIILDTLRKLHRSF